ncbi:MAG: UPF0149 family protein [Pseudomonadota bacterium]
MQDENLPVDYFAIDQALERLGADFAAAEFHGTLSGMLCAQGTIGLRALEQTVPRPEAGDVLGHEAYDLLEHCTRVILTELNDPECGFQVLLPEDDQDLQLLTEALADWCHGFLVGLSNSGISDFNALPGEAAEFCQDLMEISRAGHYPQDDTEEDRAAFEELVEYIRMGALLINELLNPTSSAPNRQLH